MINALSVVLTEASRLPNEEIARNLARPGSRRPATAPASVTTIGVRNSLSSLFSRLLKRSMVARPHQPHTC